MTELELSRFISQFGTVKDSKIITDRNGLSKGYGFVTFQANQEYVNGQRMVYQSMDGYLLAQKDGSWVLEEPSPFCQPANERIFPMFQDSWPGTPGHSRHQGSQLNRCGLVIFWDEILPAIHFIGYAQYIY